MSVVFSVSFRVCSCDLGLTLTHHHPVATLVFFVEYSEFYTVHIKYCSWRSFQCITDTFPCFTAANTPDTFNSRFNICFLHSFLVGLSEQNYVAPVSLFLLVLFLQNLYSLGPRNFPKCTWV